MKQRTDDSWRDPETAKRFISEVSDGIPLEEVQLDIMLRLIADKKGTVASFMDVGCGNGILAELVLKTYPKACAIMLDFNDLMLSAAREKLALYGEQVRYLKSDYGDEPLDEVLAAEVGALDIIISRFSIHHQTDERKKGVYKEIFNLLKPGGVFINIEHVAAESKTAMRIFENYMVDRMYESQLAKGGAKTIEEVAGEFRKRHEKDSNIIASVGDQCEWLRNIGFSEVDCYFKLFQIAIFAGKKE